MPSRIIRESARTSPTLDLLSDGAERMFWRLTTVADDFGRFDADPRVLLAQCFPLKVDRLKVAQVTNWFHEMLESGLVHGYESGGRLYGYFPTWAKYQRVRAQESRFPDPPTLPTLRSFDDNGPQLSADADISGQPLASADIGGSRARPPVDGSIRERERERESRERETSADICPHMSADDGNGPPSSALFEPPPAAGADAPSGAEAPALAPASSNRRITALEVFDGWNELCAEDGLPRKTKLTEGLRKKINARIRTLPSYQDWVLVLNWVANNPRYHGHNKTGWFCTLNWLVDSDEHLLSVYEEIPHGTQSRAKAVSA